MGAGAGVGARAGAGAGPSARVRAGAAVLLALAAVVSLSACSFNPWASTTPESRNEVIARSSVAELVQNITRENGDDIGVFARRAAELTTQPSAISLIGYRSIEAAELSAPLGELQFQVGNAFADAGTGDGSGNDANDGTGAGDGSVDTEPRPYCFAVEFSYYGKAVGQWETVEGIEPFDCPDDAAAVTPPPDETVYPVVAVNAVEVAQRVLTELPAGAVPAGDVIAAMISAELTAPEGEFQATAEPSVLVDGSRVGVAMGSADDCVLMQRVDDVVTQLFVPRVLLQPGELGCAPSTALAPAESLRSPH